MKMAGLMQFAYANAELKKKCFYAFSKVEKLYLVDVYDPRGVDYV